MIVIVDGGSKQPAKMVLSDGSTAYEVLNEVKIILGDGRERHIAVTHEGVVVDLVEGGEIIDTQSIMHDELIESPEGWEV